jgi:hypothetical protein
LNEKHEKIILLKVGSPAYYLQKREIANESQKISRNDIENTSGELRNKINYSKARNRHFTFSEPSRVAEVLGFECHYYDQSFSADIERVKHIDLDHLGKLCYLLEKNLGID